MLQNNKNRVSSPKYCTTISTDEIRVKKKVSLIFYVFLTVYLSIISVINQLNAQNLVLLYVYCMPLHVSSTMCSSSGGHNCIVQHLVSSH